MFPVPRAYEADRIGKKEQGKNRPIKVELGSANDVDFVLGHARNLKDSDKFKNVFLGPDRT